MVSSREKIRRWLETGAIYLPFALPLYLVRFHLGPLPTTLLEVLILVELVGVTLLGGRFFWQEAIKKVHREGWSWLLLAWLLIGFIEALLAPGVFAGLGLWRAYILEPVLVFVALHGLIREEVSRRRLERSLLFVALPLAVWAVYQFVTGTGIPHPWDVSIAAGRRATGPYPFPNALALFIVPIAALAFARWAEAPRQKFPLIAFLSGLVATVTAKSDGGLIALLAATALIAIGYRIGRRLVVGTFILGGAVLALLPTLQNKIWKLLTFQEWSGRVRVWMWQETWQMLKAHWLIGAGMGGYPQVFAAYHQKKFIEIFQYPHTLLFNFWSEVGIVGLMVLLLIVAQWLLLGLRAWRAKGYRYAVLLTVPLIAILIQGLVDVPYFKNDLALEFWILLFLAILSFHTERIDALKKA